jgi:hypothetical protein
MSDVRWWKPVRDSENTEGVETPGDTGAADIVGRTGEEMPDVAHDDGRPITPTDPSSMPRADDHPDGVEGSFEFHDLRRHGKSANR